MAPIVVIDHLGHVVVNDEASEAYFLQRLDCGDHIHIAFAGKALLEIGHAALHIAEVHIEDLAALAEVADGFQYAIVVALSV